MCIDGLARMLAMLLPRTAGLSLVAGRLLLLSIMSWFSMIKVLLAWARGRLLMSWEPMEEDIFGDSASTLPLFLSSIWSLIWLSMSPRGDPAEKSCEDRLIGFDTHAHLHLHMQESAWSRNLGGLFLVCLFSDSISLEWVSLLLASSMIWFSTSSWSVCLILRYYCCAPSTFCIWSTVGWGDTDFDFGSLLTLVVKIRSSFWAFSMC